MSKTAVASYLLVVALILAVLELHLVPAVFAGFLVYSLTQKLSETVVHTHGARLPVHVKAVAFATVVSVVVAAIAGFVFLAIHFIKGPDGVGWLLGHVGDVLDRLRQSVPAAVQQYVPASVDDGRLRLAAALKTHGEKVSEMGMNTALGLVHVFLGLVIGGMVSFASFATPDEYKPLSRELLQRFVNLLVSFQQVVFAQVKISAINTTLTAIYLIGVLPLFGVHLPLVKTLIAVTFLAGLLPVVGNLISNSIIVVLSLGLSFKVGTASLVFLIAVHKLEYFLNARIIGGDIDAAAWELIVVMVAMEAVFGVPGLVSAPVLYACLKRELRNAGLIGRTQPEASAVVGQTPAPSPTLGERAPG
jgi:predicted PurR-regulated permease PerM